MSSWDMDLNFRFLREEIRILQVDSVAVPGVLLLKMSMINKLKKYLDKIIILLRLIN